MAIKPINVKMTVPLIERLDKAYKASDEFNDRSSLIRAAVIAYLVKIEKKY